MRSRYPARPTASSPPRSMRSPMVLARAGWVTAAAATFATYTLLPQAFGPAPTVIPAVTVLLPCRSPTPRLTASGAAPPQPEAPAHPRVLGTRRRPSPPRPGVPPGNEGVGEWRIDEIERDRIVQ